MNTNMQLLTQRSVWKALPEPPIDRHSRESDHAQGAWQTGGPIRAQRFTQGVVWNINSFDRWGMELGEALAQRITPELESPTQPQLNHDRSSNNRIRDSRTLRKTT